ncbi:MAG: patatin-like phospholipase family protein [Solirubrobacterales bacterium]|nr:patatin-like phospholipase family protein [Solirubrobacterales bacterium]
MKRPGPSVDRPADASCGTPPRVGLVLGAGGTVGIAWLVGALEAVRRQTGWDAASADIISGTSAGSVVGALLAARIDPATLLDMAEDPAALDRAITAATAGREHRPRSPAWPGSLALGLTGLLSSDPHRRLSSLTGFLPAGPRSTGDIRGITHAAAAHGWPTHTQLWLNTCDYKSGRRVTFGRDGAPEADLADAIAASCAVPGYYQPVDIGDRSYVDGGLWSFTNADALSGAGCDLVICLSPTSSRERGSVLDTALCGPLRAVTGQRLRRETAVLRAQGTEVLILEPSAADLGAMGINPMGISRSRQIIETAVASVGQDLTSGGCAVGLERLADVAAGAARVVAAA